MDKVASSKILKGSLIVASLLISALIILNKDRFASLQGYGYVGIFLFSVLENATVLVPIPVSLTALVGGSIFNPYLVGLVTALGATIGELTGYMAGIGGKVFVEKNANYKKIRKWIYKHALLTIFTLAAIPNPLFDLAGISAGITHYSLNKFLLVTFLGKAVKFVIIALLGAYIF